MTLLIAEVKTRSPFGWEATESWDERFELAARVGDWVSVHTDARWGGSLRLLERARSLTHKPLLAKGTHASDQEVDEAFAAGADYVLVVGRVPPHRNVLIEPLTVEEMDRVPPEYRTVWNARDLTTGQPKALSFASARARRSGWLCQASLVRHPRDVHPWAEAVLVGTYLREFVEALKLPRLTL